MKYIFTIITIILNLCTFQVHSVSKDKKLKIDQQLITNAKRYGVVGQSVLVLKNNKLIYRGTNGFANKELEVKVNKKHIFPSYSVAKLFTSVLIMQLVESGDVQLSDSVRKYIPYLPKHWQNITVEHLLTHTSGVPQYFNSVLTRGSFLADKNAVYKSIKDAPEHFPIGTKNQYNNTNFLLLSTILESFSNKSFKQLVEENIIQIAGLENTGYASAKSVIANMVSSYQGEQGTLKKNLNIDWPEYSFSHSALYSTPEDLAKFMTNLLTGKFVKLKTIQSSWRPTKLKNGKAGSYAFGFEYSKEDGFIRVGHDGGNRVKLRHYYNQNTPAENYTIVYMTNGNAYDVWTDVLADSVMSIISPETFELASLKEKFITAVLNNNKTEMNRLFTLLSERNLDANLSLERFLLYRAYAIRYGCGIKASLPAFEFIVEKFPHSKSARTNFQNMKKASNSFQS